MYVDLNRNRRDICVETIVFITPFHTCISSSVNSVCIIAFLVSFSDRLTLVHKRDYRFSVLIQLAVTCPTACIMQSLSRLLGRDCLVETVRSRLLGRDC